MAGISRSVTLTIAYLMKHFAMPMQIAYQYVKERRPAISPNLNFMGQLVEFENCADEKECVALKLSDYKPSLEQEELSEGVKSRGSGSSTEHTPEASRGTPEAPKLVHTDSGSLFVLKLPASNKRKNKKKVSPRTSPRILTEDAVDLTPTKPSGSDKDSEEHSPVNSVTTGKGSGTTLPALLLRKGSVEQAIKSFEKLQSSDP